MSLMTQPPELLELSLSYLLPQEAVSFGQTCKAANAFIHPENNILWRFIFLNLYDDPEDTWKNLVPTARIQNRQREITWRWYDELRKRAIAFNAVSQPTDNVLLSNPEQVVTTLLDVIQTASSAGTSRNLTLLTRLFATAANSERIVHDYHRDMDSVSLPPDLRLENVKGPITRAAANRAVVAPDWVCKFHIHYGLTARERHSTTSKRAARAIVYSWTGTDESADYGPFSTDFTGDVKWQTVEAIMSLMQRIFDIARQPNLYRMPSGFENSIPRCLPPNASNPEDWAGVEREWVGTYAFLDYRALSLYNFAQGFRQQTYDLGDQEEACGDLMTLDLHLSDFELLRDDHRLQTELPYCKDLPILYFTGTSNNGPNGRIPITVKGFACLVPGGREVRWRFIIGYADQDQWQLEGVQPGGIRSGGIYGLWSHVSHDPQGPIGPFSYFPIEACDFTDS